MRRPAEITRSIHLTVDYADPAAARADIQAAIDAGCTHLILGLAAPDPPGAAQWVADELIAAAS